MELQLPSTHEWSGTYWYWDYVMTTKMMTEGSLREAKEQLEEVKAQIEVITLAIRYKTHTIYVSNLEGVTNTV